MKITSVKSHVLEHEIGRELGYSQQYFTKRTAHLVEVATDEGIVGIGECFGPGTVALANRVIVEQVIQPMVVGMDPLDREVVWHRVYNNLRDHGQKGMALEALSGVDIALWDIAGKSVGLPLHKLIGGSFRDRVVAYGYGMMLRKTNELARELAAEAADLECAGFKAMKMKIGLGSKRDLELVAAVRRSIRSDHLLMVDANHCYTASEALTLGRALEGLGVSWFEEPLAPEDLDGYRLLTTSLDLNIAGGETEFTRWGWRHLLERRCVDIAQPEVCSLGGISEYLKVLALAHTHFTPVVNHVWGSAIAVATNLHLLAAMPPLPGSVHPVDPMLEVDTTLNRFRDELLVEPLDLARQVRKHGSVAVPQGPGLGVEVDREFLAHYAVP